MAKTHLSALGAELVALIVDVGPAGTSPKADCGASCERFCGDAKSGAFDQEGTMEVPQGQYIDRIVDVSVCCNTKYDPSEQCTSRQHIRQWTASEFNVPEGRSRSTKFGSLTELLRYWL